jgi:predicted O-methyltransferase YrrM
VTPDHHVPDVSDVPDVPHSADLPDSAALPDLASLVALATRTKGFMPDDEAAALRGAAVAAEPGVWLEVGTYCGKSTVHLGAVAADRGSQLVTLDHHHGSEENQPGWTWHDPSLVDPRTGRLDTLPSLRHTLAGAGLDDVVSVLVATTQQVAHWWTTPLTLLFLDGSHTEEAAQHDYAAFARHLVPGGVLAVHDVFPDPRDGGQPPWHVVQRALREGTFTQAGECGSLRVLRRTRVGHRTTG